MSNFPDHFSKQSAVYKRYRPGYPDELFSFLSSLTESHDLAWDCGSGNGQSAIGLTNYFNKIIATDPSADQISHAAPHEKIEYRVEKAEEPALDDHSVDLVTIAQAVHWFDLDKFYSEVRRVLKPEGVIAVWTYGLPKLTPQIDDLVLQYHNITVDEFWQEGNRMVEKEYATLNFPFQIIDTPAFMMYSEFTAENLSGLLRSWSATQRFIDAKGYEPVIAFESELQKIWGVEETITASWKIILKAGRMKA